MKKTLLFLILLFLSLTTYGQSARDRIIKKIISNMVYVEGGTFEMGAWDEKVQVTLSSFYIGKYEVTEEEWLAIMGKEIKQGPKHPKERLSWDECQSFIRKLNQLTGKKFRLPTEAEWEFAARGGNKSKGYMYSGSNDPDSVAWTWEWLKNTTIGAKKNTQPIGQKKPNELGIYDMSGNVFEWCQDCAEAGFHGHDQDKIDLVEEGQHCLRSRARLEGDSRFLPKRSCDVDRGKDVFPAVCLDMEVDQIRTGTAESFGIADRFKDHQMGVDKHIRCLAKRFQHGYADGNVGNEASVHYVKMNVIGAGETDFLHLCAKIGKISG